MGKKLVIAAAVAVFIMLTCFSPAALAQEEPKEQEKQEQPGEEEPQEQPKEKKPEEKPKKLVSLSLEEYVVVGTSTARPG